MGEFDQYTIDDLYEMVRADDPSTLAGQAEGWTALSGLLNGYAAALRTRLGQARGSWTGGAADVYFTALASRCDALDAAGETARRNSRAWLAVSDSAARAQGDLTEIMRKWQDHKGDSFSGRDGTSSAAQEEERKPYDEAAREVMDRETSTVDLERSSLADHEPFTPMPDVELPGDGDADGGGTGGGGEPDPGGHGFPGGSGPSLQSATPAPTTPAPGTVVPGTPPAGAAPLPPAPALPPAPVGASPRFTPRPGPGVPAPRPGVPGSNPPRPGTSGGTPPRPAQPTVRPVIGSRPGTVPANPAAPRVVPNIARPVIGSRPGVVRNPVPPKGSLIGKDGVIRRRTARPGVRVARAWSGGPRTNRALPGVAPSVTPNRTVSGTDMDVPRLSERPRTPDPTDPFAISGATVPGVITSRPSPAHDPGPKLEFTAPPHHEHEHEHEHDTVRRAAAPPTAGSSWIPAAGRGVITGRPIHQEANDAE